MNYKRICEKCGTEMTPNISLSETTEMLFSVNLETMDEAAYDRCCDQANELFKCFPAKEIVIC